MNFQTANFFKQQRKSQYKVIIIGDAFAGKTSLCFRYCQNSFGSNYKATLGADYFSKEISTGVSMSLVDTAGQERFLSVASSYYRGADGAIICYDVTNRQSFTNIATWLDIVGQQVNPKETPIMIMGNKCDLNNKRQVSQQEGQIFANQLGFPFVEVSAKSGFNVDVAFDVLIDQMLYGIENKMYQGKSFLWSGYCYIPANGKLLRISDSSDYSRCFKVTKALFNVDIIGTNARVEAVLSIATEHCPKTICMFALTVDDFYENLQIQIDKRNITTEVRVQSVYEPDSQIILYSQKTYIFNKLYYVDLGQTFPGEQLEVKFSYLERLELFQTKFFKCFLYYLYNKHFCLVVLPKTLLDQPPSIYDVSMMAAGQMAYIKIPWEIKIKLIQPNAPITFLRSSTHFMETDWKDQEQTTVSINVNDNAAENTPYKDFVLLFATTMSTQPYCIIQQLPKWKFKKEQLQNKYAYCAHLTFSPPFDTTYVTDEQAYLQYLYQENESSTDPIDIECANYQGEFIFLLDRSGSMSGERIELVKEVIVIFLKSLPFNCQFNIVSFGSRHEHMFSQNQKYVEQVIDKAIYLVEEMSANFGGTDIYDALVDVFNHPSYSNWPRNIFLLTDGEVGNTQQIITLVKERCSEQMRLFTIGIGSGACKNLISDGAKFGHGIPEFIINHDHHEIAEKIIEQLHRAIQPFEQVMEFHYDENVMELIAPNYDRTKVISKDFPFDAFFFMNKNFDDQEFTIVKVKTYDNIKQTVKNYEFHISKQNIEPLSEECKEYAFFHMLGLYSADKILQQDNYTTTNTVWIPQNQSIYQYKKFMENMTTDFKLLNQLSKFFYSDNGELNSGSILRVKYTKIDDAVVGSSSSGSSEEEFGYLKSKRTQGEQDSSCCGGGSTTYFSYNHAFRQQQYNQQLQGQQLGPPGMQGMGGTNFQFLGRPGYYGRAQGITQVGLPPVSGLGVQAFMAPQSYPGQPLRPGTAPIIMQSQQQQIAQQFEEQKIQEAFPQYPKQGLPQQQPQQQLAGPPQQQLAGPPQQQLAQPQPLKLPLPLPQQQSQQMNQQMPQRKLKKLPKSTYLTVLKLQKPEGWWEFKDKLLTHLQLSEKFCKNQIPAQLKAIPNAYTTILVLVWLEAYFPEKKKGWKLIANKSQNWLKKQNIIFINFYQDARNMLRV